jgi:hypothetical protein
LPVRLTTHFSRVLVQASAIRCKNLVAIGCIRVNCSKLGSQKMEIPADKSLPL